MRDRHEALGLAAAAATGIVVGTAIFATGLVARDLGPFSLALLRYAIGLLCLLPFLVVAARPRIARTDLMPILGLGVLQFGILVALLNFGLRSVSAGHAALLFATSPVLTMLLAAMLGRERLTRAKSAGVALSFLGVAITLGPKLLAPDAAAQWVGVTAVVAAASCNAVCAVFYRPYLERYPTLPIGTIAMAAATVFLVAPAVAENDFAAIEHLDLTGWGAVVFIGVSSGAGYLLWLCALRFTTPTRAAVFLSLSPVVATLLDVAVLGQPLTGAVLLGLVAVVAGVSLALKPDALVGKAPT